METNIHLTQIALSACVVEDTNFFPSASAYGPAMSICVGKIRKTMRIRWTTSLFLDVKNET